jgi:hypothetical protein
MDFKDFRLAVDHQDQRSPQIADVERFVVLVENQDGSVHPADTYRFQGCRGGPSH